MSHVMEVQGAEPPLRQQPGWVEDLPTAHLFP